MKPPPEEYCRLLRTSAKSIYDSIKSIYCPVLGRNIIFNAKGFYHLSYKPDGTSRDVREIIYKLTLVPLAVPVVKNAIGVHEVRNITLPKSRKKGASKVKAKQYALTAIVGRKNPVEVRVIVLDVENSQNLIFWSIMKH